jgi:ribosomal-protein-serine acetyltransferase
LLSLRDKNIYKLFISSFIMAIELIVDDALKLIQLRPEDASELFNLIDMNREHLSQYDEPTSKKYPTFESLYASIATPPDPTRLRFGIWTNSEILGSINITPLGDTGVIGYYLGSEYQGKKIMTRSVKRLVRYCFDELHLRTISADVAADNMPSRAVLFASGFSLQFSDGKRVFYEIEKQQD